MTTQCAWCKKIKIPGGWIASDPTGVVTHGICPICMAEMRIEFKNHLLKLNRAPRLSGLTSAPGVTGQFRLTIL